MNVVEDCNCYLFMFPTPALNAIKNPDSKTVLQYCGPGLAVTEVAQYIKVLGLIPKRGIFCCNHVLDVLIG